jgi:hypothetical protein
MNPMDISLVSTTINGQRARLAVLDMIPGMDIPGASVVGSLEPADGPPNWSTFKRNTRFADAYTRYMRGEANVRPAILEDARVKPGEYVYVIDQRTPTPQGRVPWTDIVGWYESDPAGAPRPETFAYNKDHVLVTPEGRWSSVLDDDGLGKALREDEQKS